MYRSWKRRAAFIVVSIIVPIIANGMRVWGIVVLGYWLGDAQAATADHLIYGWVFFSMVSIILILLGLPFRQEVPAFAIPPAGSSNLRGQQVRMVATAGLSILFVGVLASPVVSHGPVAEAMDGAVAGLKHVLGR
jgi:exosortase/archaeosortase family protein